MKTFELFGEVGWEITVNDVKNIVNNNKNEDLNFVISTLGGDVNYGLSIYDLIKSHKGKTKATIIGMTASAGTIIAMSCDEVEMSENALFLIHNSWTQVEGNKQELNKTINDLNKIDNIMVNIYSSKTGKTSEEIKDLMNEEIWLSADEAKDMGFINNITSSNLKIAANYKLLNDKLLIKLENKMNIFSKTKKDSQIYNVISLKDGKQLIINAEEVAAEVEVLPVNAQSLEDGTYELSDGRTIVVSGGAITDVQEVKAEEGGEKEEEEMKSEIISAVGEIVSAEIKKIQSQIDDLRVKGSTHTLPKNDKVSNQTTKKGSVHSRMKGVADQIRSEIIKSRKA